MTEQETESGSPAAAAGSRLGTAAARAVAAGTWCASASAAGYALHGPALAAALAVAGAAAGAVVIMLLTAVIGCKDQRSPFERLMLLACLLVGRRPADYLPPVPPDPGPLHKTARIRSGVYQWSAGRRAAVRQVSAPRPDSGTPLPTAGPVEGTSAAGVFRQLFPSGVQMTAELLADLEQWARLTGKLAAKGGTARELPSPAGPPAPPRAGSLIQVQARGGDESVWPAALLSAASPDAARERSGAACRCDRLGRVNVRWPRRRQLGRLRHSSSGRLRHRSRSRREHPAGPSAVLPDRAPAWCAASR